MRGRPGDDNNGRVSSSRAMNAAIWAIDGVLDRARQGRPA
jgi:hypothetical protein